MVMMIRVADIMKSPLALSPETLVTYACKLMGELDSPCCLVLQGDKPVGIVTETDIVRRLISQKRDPLKTVVKDIMSSPPITVEPEESLRNAARLMIHHNIRRLPVLKDGKLLGIVRAVDFARHVSGKKNFLELLAESIENPSNVLPIPHPLGFPY